MTRPCVSSRSRQVRGDNIATAGLKACRWAFGPSATAGRVTPYPAAGRGGYFRWESCSDSSGFGLVGPEGADQVGREVTCTHPAGADCCNCDGYVPPSPPSPALSPGGCLCTPAQGALGVSVGTCQNVRDPNVDDIQFVARCVHSTGSCDSCRAVPPPPPSPPPTPVCGGIGVDASCCCGFSVGRCQEVTFSSRTVIVCIHASGACPSTCSGAPQPPPPPGPPIPLLSPPATPPVNQCLGAPFTRFYPPAGDSNNKISVSVAGETSSTLRGEGQFCFLTQVNHATHS